MTHNFKNAKFQFNSLTDLRGYIVKDQLPFQRGEYYHVILFLELEHECKRLLLLTDTERFPNFLGDTILVLDTRIVDAKVYEE